MFSALKRLTSKGDASPNNSTSARPPGHQSMSSSLQKKFARGVQYNMKIVIKGDRNVGKTCLFHRLEGKKFFEEYLPTEEIQVTSIQWNYKATDDVVKVEVWDVVDRGKKKKRFDGLKLENSQLEVAEEPALDAEFLDVYKGTNGVILMFDLTKTWTFDYVQRELPKVPAHIPVIVLANHCDMSHHRTVTSDHVTYFIESLQGNRSAQIRYAESSMRNGFGLKLLHKFFNLPFLQLQRETLLKQLDRNECETKATIDELDSFFDSDDANYNKFLDNLMKKRREIADSNANIPIPNHSASLNQLSELPPDVRRSQSGPIFIGGGKPIPVAAPAAAAAPTAVTSLEEFCPDGGQLDSSFLDADTSSGGGGPAGGVQLSSTTGNADSDSEEAETSGNPLVSELQDDFEEVKPQSNNSDYDMKQTNDELDSTINSEISEITSEAFDTWLATDSKWRRSPEGGEDVSTTLDYTMNDDSTSVTSSNLQMELLSVSKATDTSDSDKVKKNKKPKEKKDKKHKHKKKEKSKSGGEKSHDELEEFLNGSVSPVAAAAAYEAL